MLRRLLRRSAVLALFLIGAVPGSAENLKIAVYHTNDIHGWVMARPAAFYQKDPTRLVGGFPALSNLIKKETQPHLLIDAGDWFQGTPEGNLTQGQSLVDLFNALPYDAVEIGNHEFDFGEKRLKELAVQFKAPVLGANIYREVDRKRVPYAKPWIVKEVAGVKVGIFGLLTTNMRNLTFPENYAGLYFRREVDEAKDAVKALKKQGATVIIAVTHVGFESPELGKFEGDQTIASEVPGIDLILGGHSHTFLKEPVRDATHGTLIAQAGTTLSSVGKVELEIDPKTKKVVSSSGRLVELWIDEVGEDPAVLKVMRKYSDEVSKVYDVVVATAAGALMRNRDGESVLGDWMTDCERDWAGADVAIQNAGGIRSDLREGPVTLRHLYNIMPFDNRVVRLTMNGRLVRDVLDHGVGKTKGMIQVSGVAFAYARDKARGERLKDVLVGGKPLDPAASYRVATIDFLVKGGDGYTPFDLAEKKDFTRVLLRDVLNDCAKKRPLIAPPPSGRMHRMED